ncbi:hypothetical protein VNI00_002519 [Paramarasmius palmivorus]|uniref:F-box domain-containing protein n=1 Tax=Paramarasmius palmivorus TaxID=297713 RepID=A0AAW0DYQ8_9AGAR
MSSTRTVQIPTEMWHNALEFASPTALLKTIQVSKQLRDVSTMILYRSVTLHSPHSFISCLRTLSTNDNAARSLRRLLIVCDIKHPGAALIRLAGVVFRRIAPSLVHLELNIPMFDQVLSTSHFSRLSSFTFRGSVTTNIADFVNRHSHILSSLSLHSTGISQLQNEWLFRGDFQQLTTLTGTVDTVTDMLFASLPRLESVDVSSAPTQSHSLTCFLTLLSCQSSQLTELIIRGDPGGLVTEFVAFRSPQIMYVVVHTLKRFEGLKTLRWLSPKSSDPYNFDRDLYIVTLFGVACPSLSSCELTKSSWDRITGKIWIPRSVDWREPSAPSAHDWLFHALYSEQYPLLDQLLDHLSALSSEAHSLVARYRKIQKGGTPEQKEKVVEDIMHLGQEFCLWNYEELWPM